jgi:surfactin synthase thioesterase subunit
MGKEFEPSHALRVLKPASEPRARLVCLPYAGGAASLFHAWSPSLPADVELRAVQLPARQDRRQEAPMRRVEDIVDHLARAVAALPAVPTAIFGHSFGALVAFELARRLGAEGRPPICLVASARRAPHLPLAHPPLHKLGDADFLAGMNRYCSTPLDRLRDRDLVDLALPALRADFEALETFTYRAGGPLEVPTVILRGRLDPTMSRESALAWSEIVGRQVGLHEVDAGHFFIDSHRHWVLERVNEALRAGLATGRKGDGLGELRAQGM